MVFVHMVFAAVHQLFNRFLHPLLQISCLLRAASSRRRTCSSDAQVASVYRHSWVLVKVPHDQAWAHDRCALYVLLVIMRVVCSLQ
jgi:hypothetical protein